MISDHLKVLIVGLGQIGGSIGIDLVKNRLVDEVLGFDIDATTIQEALRRQAINSAVSSLKEGVRQVDLVILAVPIRKIIELIPDCLSSAREGTTFMDVAGTKTEIFAVLDKIPAPVNYISCHPLAGNEKRGIEAAESAKFRDTDFIFVPFEGIAQSSLELIRSIVQSLGARPLIMSAEEHDRLISLTSHLPYLFALALTSLAIRQGKDNEKIWNLIGGSFKSATRVAVSSPDLTLDMFLTNKKYLGTRVNELIAELTEIKEKIQDGDEKYLEKLIKLTGTKVKELQSE